jgi:hypothetical protein
MIETSGAGLNFWYIEDKSNRTLAHFAKRSGRIVGHIKGPSLSRRSSFSEAGIDELTDGFGDVFNLNLTEIVYDSYPNPFAGLSSSPSSRISSGLSFVDGSEVG